MSSARSSISSGAVPAARRVASLARLVVVAVLAAVPAARAQDGGQAGRRAGGLFDSDDVLRLTLTTNLKALLKDRDTTSEYRPATLSYVDASGAQVSQDVRVRTRGHFRLARRNCAFPPLRLNVSKRRSVNSVFANQNALKLVTHCQKSEEYEQYVLQEYLIYKIYNLLTPRSFRVRLAQVTYVDRAGKSEPLTKPAFFIEDDKQMAARNGAQIVKVKGASPEQLDPGQMGLVAVFQYLIGNTDWSLPALHNITLMRTREHIVFPVAYDFDLSGVISTRYAKPPPQLPIKSVRDRLYRGDCRTEEQLAPIFAQFIKKRGAMYALYRNLKGLQRRYVERTHEYFDEFYRTISNRRAVRREFVQSCVGR